MFCSVSKALGVVAAVGKDVTTVKEGQSVMIIGMKPFGYTEYVVS